MLFNEPKLLKYKPGNVFGVFSASFSALQRAEIAEIMVRSCCYRVRNSFSALQRAEIAEIPATWALGLPLEAPVSVLFNEPKLLKFRDVIRMLKFFSSFSALQRAEIAEIQ